VIVTALTIAMAATMLWYGWEMFHLAWERNWTSESVWKFPLWISYLAMPLGFGLYLMQLLVDLWIAAFAPPGALPEVHPERSLD
jgi:TRAP-type C4-dicarboxylate transport system permease small subunit